ncbi:MAG: glycosyltransferase [Chitinophagaceae bacterium]|nr:glycosyltransferase [Chitinophagaceae bacterium]
MGSIFIIGPAHPLRGGGIVSFNERLATAFQESGYSCEIWSFSLQYPSFLFPGKTQFSTSPAPPNLTIHSVINSINPFNWIRVGMAIRKRRPSLVVVRFWIPFMGPCLGTILRIIKRKETKIICIADNAIPHEKRPGDRIFSSYFFNSCDAFIAMSKTVETDLKSLVSNKPVQRTVHPLYDHFGNPVSKSSAREKLGISPSEKVILFFGFIRKYKGLDLLLEAMCDSRIKEQNIKLLIAGEFYEKKEPFLAFIEDNKLNQSVRLDSHFIADSEIANYLCAADVVVQPYRNATQSGVTPLAFHFEKPMIVTNVGGLPEMVPNEGVGLVCAPTPNAIADAIIRFYEKGVDSFHAGIVEEKKKYDWSTMINTIMELSQK